MESVPDSHTDPPADDDDDALDPRIQIELERLNHANEAINHLELQLDDARQTLQEFRSFTEVELLQLEKRIGVAVIKARSYYEARVKLRDAREALTKAKHRFERAQALHVAAKELALVSADYIDEAESSNQNAATWNETYSHAIAQAANAEREKYQADLDQQRMERAYVDIEKSVEKYQKDFRRSINKSQPYYEMKAEYHKELDFQKRKVYGLETCVQEAKSQYQQSLRNLERISNEIHEQRNQNKPRADLGERTSGVGEEQPSQTDSAHASASTPLQRTASSDDMLRSCLLRTETLPTGVFHKATGDRSPPEGNDTFVDPLNDQFILRSKAPPQPSVFVYDGTLTTTSFPSRTHRRTSSHSSQFTIDGEQDDDTRSLHVLSDEQIDYLASGYETYPSEKDPIEELLVQLQHSTLQAQTFFRNLFKS